MAAKVSGRARIAGMGLGVPQLLQGIAACNT